MVVSCYSVEFRVRGGGGGGCLKRKKPTGLAVSRCWVNTKPGCSTRCRWAICKNPGVSQCHHSALTRSAVFRVAPGKLQRFEYNHRIQIQDPTDHIRHIQNLSVQCLPEGRNRNSAEHIHTVHTVHLKYVHKYTRAQYVRIHGTQWKYVSAIRTSDQGHYPMHAHTNRTCVLQNQEGYEMFTWRNRLTF